MKMAFTGDTNMVATSTITTYYTCTMHPQVQNPKPGKCAILWNGPHAPKSCETN